jgi:hypothetical protein
MVGPKVAGEIHRGCATGARQGAALVGRTCRACFGGARFVYASGQRPSRSLHCDASSTNDICHISSDTPTASEIQTCTHRQLHVQHHLAHSPALASPFRLAPTSSRSWHARRIACAPTAPHQTNTFNAATHHIHVLSHGRKGKQCAFHSSCFWVARAAAAAQARQSQGTLGTRQRRACAYPANRHCDSATTRACWQATTTSRAASERLMVTI